MSGKVESWVGVTAVTSTSGGTDDDMEGSYLASGGSAMLSLPLGAGLAMQMDASWERNLDTLADSSTNDDRFEHSFQGAAHFSMRDPSFGLIGVFGGAGKAVFENGNDAEFAFVGGEGQLYLQDWTLYAQAGAILSSGDDDILGNTDEGHEAFFVRGVARWFIDGASRLQVEGAFANGDVDGDDDGNMDIFEWGVRYDRIVGLPLLGDTQMFVAYRGNSFDKNEDDPGAFVDHTFMVGTSMHFGGNSMQEFDRVGATLDTPNIGRWVISGEQVE